MKPYASKIMPITGHPMTTKKKPAPNEIVPCITSKANVVSSEHEIQQLMQGSHMHKETDRLTTLKFWRFMKNCMVDFGPIVRLTPEMKRIWSSTAEKEPTLK
jgi:hypothetical protein